MKRIAIYILLGVLAISAVGCRKNNADEEYASAEIPVEEASELSTKNESSKAMFPEGVQIEEQTFEVTLNDWGEVTFAPFAPENPYDKNGDIFYPDIQYYLLKDGQAVCKFGAIDEKSETGNVFLSVEAVSFTDYNDDGLSDVITICNYELENGNTYLSAEVYFQLEDKQGFISDPLLNEYFDKQHCCNSIMDVNGAKEEWWYHVDGLDGSHSQEAQMQIFVDNVSLWRAQLDYADELWKYAVTNLDLDDKNEIIVSQCGGTGCYTYSRIFEVNDTFDGLVEITTDFSEGNSQPDIMDEKVDVYWKNPYLYYVFTDTMKNGAGEHYQNESVISLQENKLIVTSIVFKDSIYDIENEELVVTVRDANGNKIPEEAYNTEVQKYFEGCEKYFCTIGWQDMRTLSDDPETMKEQLKESDGKFCMNAYN